MRLRVLDLFAGPGGWDEGLKLLGVADVVGLEWCEWACRTAQAAGHLRAQADVATYPPDPFAGVDGVIASPPCPSFSSAGRGAGRQAMDELLAHAHGCAAGWVDPPGAICTEDVRADLTLQLLRWVDALRPRWVALEQVPPVLPLWQVMAEVLRGWGYSVWAGILNAADYGVPQTRQRAFLLARTDGYVEPPAATHAKHPGVSLLGETLPWVTMAEALGWNGEVDRRTNSRGARGTTVPTVTVPTDRPSPTVTGEGAGGQWVLRNNNQERACVRGLDEPAGTIFVGNNLNRIEWCYERPAPTITSTRRSGSGGLVGRQLPPGEGRNVGGWGWERPSTTVCADHRIGRPGHKDRDQGESQFAEGAVRVEQWELGVLQGFRPDYPWQGTKTKQGQQVGNAVPPPLAAAVLEQMVDAEEVAA